MVVSTQLDEFECRFWPLSLIIAKIRSSCPIGDFGVSDGHKLEEMLTSVPEKV